MIGSIQTTNANLMAGAPEGTERRFVFIGTGLKNSDQLLMINQDSDLLDLLGAGTLYDNVKAFSDNALVGGGFLGAVYPIEEKVEAEVMQDIELSGFVPEVFIYTDVYSSKEEIESVQTTINDLKAGGVFAFAMVALPGIDTDTQTWSQYQTATNTIVKDVVASSVVAVPQINGNNLGVLAGRLCREDLSVSDTPIRTKSGAVLGLGAFPLDSSDQAYSNAHAAALDGIRVSVPQFHGSQPGTYWADSNTLDAPTGDFKVTDYLRPVLKAMRGVHSRMFGRLGDRTLNNTKLSISAAESYAEKPLRDMAIETTMAGQTVPGDIYPPEDGDVSITFTGKNEITVYLGVRPIDAPKKIKNNVFVISE